MDENNHSNLNNNYKINVSESQMDISHSIDALNNNFNRMTKILNASNQNNNMKDISDSENFNISSSIGIDYKNNISNSNRKIKDPSIDLYCKNLQHKIDTLEYENYTLTKKNKDLLSQIEDLKLRLASINKNKEAELKLMNEELINTKNKSKKNEEELLKMDEKMKQNMNDIKKLEKNKKIAFEMQSENNKLNDNHKKLNETILTLEKNLEFYKDKFNVMSSDYEILKKERELVNKDSFILKEKNKDLINDKEKLMDEIKSLKDDKNKLMKKIRDYDMLKKKEYDELISRTKEKLDQKKNEEIEKIQNDQNSIMRIKIKSLEEQNEELKERILEMKEKEKDNNDINKNLVYEESKKQISMLSDEVSYLKLQIQLKDSENKRLNRIYTENIDLIKELNIENSSYKEKLKLLNDKLNEVSSNNYNELSGIKEKVALLKARNQSYEEEDKAFDKIFEEGILDGVGNNSDEETKNLINGINELPKGNNRRISQLRFLVNKLKNLAQNNAILNARLNNLQIENNKYKEESNIYQNIAQNSNEPYEYLFKELEKKDSELVYCKEVIADREIRYKQAMKDNEELRQKYNDIERDLKQVLENRDKINNLEYLVGVIAENQKKFMGGDKFVQFDDKLVTKTSVKVGKKSTGKKGNKKYK